jgi:hypothetical protein
LFAARAYSTSEPDLENGAGTGLYWILALLVVAGLAIAAGFVGGRLRFRWSWTDAAVIALVVLVATSALHAIDRRPAINLAWEWMAMGVAYLLLRNLPRTREESSVLAVALVVVAIAVSIYGLYQVGVELKPLRDAYRRNPQAVLQFLKIAPGSPAQAQFEDRLMRSSEPFSTFALANSLAGFIVGPLVMLLAVAYYNLVRGDSTRSRWSALAMAAPLILILLVCLILTKSRSAWIGLLVGVAVAAWQSRRLVSTQLMLGAGLAGMVVISTLVAAGLAAGQLDQQVLTQSAMSMRYRWEYWQGTWKVITGGQGDPWQALGTARFWSGIGPGNFRSYYLRYKRPEWSEEILDPHNLFLEVWATGGFGAFLALLAALALGIWNLLGSPPQFPARTDAGRSPPRSGNDQRTPDPRAAPASRREDEDPDAPPRRTTWLIASAGAGWVVVVLLGLLNPFEKDLYSRWLILGVSWLTAVVLVTPLWHRLSIPPFVLGAAVVAVLINLLAAGGIGIPTVALGLWATLALGLNLRDERTCSRLREYESRVPPFVLSTVWAAVLGLFLGAVVPFWRSEAAISEAEDASRHRPPDFERASDAYKRAIAEDRYNVRPWLGYADLELRAWASRGSKAEDWRWKQVPILLKDAVSLPRNPNSWSLHILRADRIRAILQQVGPQIPPVDVVSFGAEIVKETRIATLLYPSNASLHARLAEASAEISMFGDALKEAQEALRLDGLTPHPDKKLPEPIRTRLEGQVAEWTEKASPKA